MKISKPGEPVRYEDPLSPAQVDRLAAAEFRVDKVAMEKILKEPRSELGRRLDAAARGRT